MIVVFLSHKRNFMFAKILVICNNCLLGNTYSGVRIIELEN